MTRGRKPAPTIVKLMTNTRRDRINQNEAKVPTGVPRCPPHLDKEAKAEWRRISKELSGAGLLSMVDRAALAAYCQLWSRWVEAENAVRKTGLILKGENGYYQNPYLAVANKAMEKMCRVLTEFGMTPSSRSRVHAAPQGQEIDEFEAGLNQNLA